MKKLSFAIVGAAALALAACNNSSQDAVGDNADLNAATADDLNGLAGDAANDAEAEALGNQAAQLNAEAEAAAAENTADDDVETNASDADTAVNGM